jgi:hypothetical protein
MSTELEENEAIEFAGFAEVLAASRSARPNNRRRCWVSQELDPTHGAGHCARSPLGPPYSGG